MFAHIFLYLFRGMILPAWVKSYYEELIVNRVTSDGQMGLGGGLIAMAGLALSYFVTIIVFTIIYCSAKKH